MTFKNFADATTVLAEKIKQNLVFDHTWQLVAIGEIAESIGNQLAATIGLELKVAEIIRSFNDSGYQKTPEIELPQQLGSKLIVCDVGVETGTTAALIAEKLRANQSLRQLVLAVLVLPKELEPQLRENYDQLISARSPMIRRNLRWEFEEFG